MGACGPAGRADHTAHASSLASSAHSDLWDWAAMFPILWLGERGFREVKALVQAHTADWSLNTKARGLLRWGSFLGQE